MALTSDEVNPEIVERISDALTAKGVSPVCPRCGRDAGWYVLGSGLIPYTPDIAGPVDITSGGRVVTLYCNHCGSVQQHAVPLLGLK